MLKSDMLKFTDHDDGTHSSISDQPNMDLQNYTDYGTERENTLERPREGQVQVNVKKKISQLTIDD